MTPNRHLDLRWPACLDSETIVILAKFLDGRIRSCLPPRASGRWFGTAVIHSSENPRSSPAQEFHTELLAAIRRFRAAADRAGA